jgi:hypothetical protein
MHQNAYNAALAVSIALKLICVIIVTILSTFSLNQRMVIAYAKKTFSSTRPFVNVRIVQRLLTVRNAIIFRATVQNVNQITVSSMGNVIVHLNNMRSITIA